MNSLSAPCESCMPLMPKAVDTSSAGNVLRQCLNLISQFPMLMVYGYHAYNYCMGVICYHAPSPELSTAENILMMMLREDRKYTKAGGKILDMALCFTWIMAAEMLHVYRRIVTSSGTDTYSTIARPLASLGGQKAWQR